MSKVKQTEDMFENLKNKEENIAPKVLPSPFSNLFI